MNGILVEDPKYDETIHIETTLHVVGMDWIGGAKSNGRLEGPNCHGIPPVNVHVIVLDSIHWVTPYLDLFYESLGDGSTRDDLIFKIHDIFDNKDAL